MHQPIQEQPYHYCVSSIRQPLQRHALTAAQLAVARRKDALTAAQLAVARKRGACRTSNHQLSIGVCNKLIHGLI